MEVKGIQKGEDFNIRFSQYRDGTIYPLSFDRFLKPRRLQSILYIL